MAPGLSNMFSFGQSNQQKRYEPQPLPFYDVLLSAPHYKYQTPANKAYIALKPRRSRTLNVQKEVKEPLHRLLMTQQQQQQQAMNNNNDDKSIPLPTFWIGADKVRSEKDYKPGTMRTFALGKKGSMCYTVYEATDHCIIDENYRNGKGTKGAKATQTSSPAPPPPPTKNVGRNSANTLNDTPLQPQPGLPTDHNKAEAAQWRSVESDISMNTLDTQGIEAAVAGGSFDMNSMLDSSVLTVSMDAYRGSTAAAAAAATSRETEEDFVAGAMLDMMMMSVDAPPSVSASASGPTSTTSAFAGARSGAGHSHLLDSSIGTFSGTAVPGQHPSTQAFTNTNGMDNSTATFSFSRMSVSNSTSKQSPTGSSAANYAFGATKSFQWLQDQFQRARRQELDLSGQSLNDVDAATIAQLLATYNSNNNNPKIRMLYLSKNNIGDAGAAHLAGIFQQQITGAVTLIGLDLCDNRIGSTGAAAIAQSLAASQLQVLDLGGNKIGVNGAVAIATALSTAKTQLRELRLSGNDIGDVGAEAMAFVIATISTMRTLHLSNNHITAHGATSLATALESRGTKLKALHLDFNNIGIDGARAIARAIINRPNTTLEKLSLVKCHIGPEGAAAVASALSTFSAMPLLELYIPNNNIGSSGALAMAAALQRNDALRTLDLRYNNIVLSSSGSTAASSVAAAMKKALRCNKTLQELDLSGNKVSDDGSNVEAEIQALIAGRSDGAR